LEEQPTTTTTKVEDSNNMEETRETASPPTAPDPPQEFGLDTPSESVVRAEEREEKEEDEKEDEREATHHESGGQPTAAPAVVDNSILDAERVAIWAERASIARERESIQREREAIERERRRLESGWEMIERGKALIWKELDKFKDSDSSERWDRACQAASGLEDCDKKGEAERMVIEDADADDADKEGEEREEEGEGGGTAERNLIHGSHQKRNGKKILAGPTSKSRASPSQSFPPSTASTAALISQRRASPAAASSSVDEETQRVAREEIEKIRSAWALSLAEAEKARLEIERIRDEWERERKQQLRERENMDQERVLLGRIKATLIPSPQASLLASASSPPLDSSSSMSSTAGNGGGGASVMKPVQLQHYHPNILPAPLSHYFPVPQHVQMHSLNQLYQKNFKTIQASGGNGVLESSLGKRLRTEEEQDAASILVDEDDEYEPARKEARRISYLESDLEYLLCPNF